jgi:hypothetical protein
MLRFQNHKSEKIEQRKKKRYFTKAEERKNKDIIKSFQHHGSPQLPFYVMPGTI